MEIQIYGKESIKVKIENTTRFLEFINPYDKEFIVIVL